MKDQNPAFLRNEKMDVSFPDNFPTIEQMMVVLRKTFEKSWMLDRDIDDVFAWLNNFKGVVYQRADEQRLALWLLCNFTFYNSKEINHLCVILYKKMLHQMVCDSRLESEDEINSCLNNLFFTSIGNASESGGLILYHFRQEAQLSLDRFYFPTTLKECTTENDTILCIDDVMLSGGTASRFFYKGIENIRHKQIYYLALFTSPTAIDKLSKLGIKVIYTELIDDRSKAFSSNSLCFFNFPELRDLTKIMIEEYGRQIEPDNPLGYKDGQYCLGLYYNTPNNSLPIFWSTNKWTPILPRKEKIQNVKQCDRQFDFFI